jgi:DNA-directed RNA polymerase specialized sigma24 family protein
LQQKEDSVKNGVSTVNLDSMIKAALTGQPHNQRRLYDEALRYSRRLSKAKAPDLAEDLHEEVFQEAQCLVIRDGDAGLAKHSGKQLFRRAVMAAIRIVRANNAPPGQKTRWTREPPPPRVAAEDIGRVADTRDLERSSAAEVGGIVIDFDKFPDRRVMQVMEQVEVNIDLEAILARAPEQVAWALKLIHLNDAPIKDVAALATMSRFTLHRRITAFIETVRAAA